MPIRNKIFATICVLLFGCWGYLGVTTLADDFEDDGEAPLHLTKVTVENGKQDAFIRHLRSFADKHGFAIRVAPVRPGGKHIIVEMWREDFKILAVNPFDPCDYEIGIYANDSYPSIQKHADALMSELESFDAK